MPDAEAARIVFVADDDLGLVRLIERSLQREGWKTASASTGKETIEWLAKNQADLLLLDLKLKDGEGGEVISQLNALNRKVPFLIITGQGDERVAVEMMKRGARDYLVKDANFLELVPAVVGRTLTHLQQEQRLAAAEETAERSRALTKAVLNSLPALIAVLDDKGCVVAVNEPWERNHADGADPVFAQALVGENYLEVCREAARRNEPGAGQIAANIVAVLESGEVNPAVEYAFASKGGERWYSTTVIFLAGSTNGAVVTHYEVTERKRLEAAVLQIAETERQRVAADLHDGICQELAGIAFTVAALQRELTKGRSRAAGKVKAIEAAITDAVAHTRQVARGLNAVVADGHGLMHALEQLAATTRQTHRVACKFDCPTVVPIEDPISANELYRIAQEAVSNAVRHGKGKEIAVRLLQQDAEVCLVVEDDGRGLAPVAPQHQGMGLRVMQYRAALIGGRLNVRRRKGGGTEVTCCIAAGRKSAPQKNAGVPL
jgi:signal transduction histidine kinase/FixJ family two-component response regulator